MPASASRVSKAVVNWPARSRIRYLNAVVCSPSSSSRFRACWAVHGPVRVGGDAQDVHAARLDLHDEQHVEPSQRHRVDVEEVDREHPGRPARAGTAASSGRGGGSAPAGSGPA